MIEAIFKLLVTLLTKIVDGETSDRVQAIAILFALAVVVVLVVVWVVFELLERSLKFAEHIKKYGFLYSLFYYE